MTTRYHFALLTITALSLSPTIALAQTVTKPPAPAQIPKGKGVPLGKLVVAPPPGFLLFQKALKATEAGKYAEAERLYRQIVHDTPDAGAAWANLGLLVGRQGRTKEAIEYLTKATRVAPETGAFWSQLAAYQLRNKQWQAAEASSLKALAREPKNMLAIANLADALFQQRRYQEAVPVLQKLRVLEGNPPSDHTDISLILALSASSKASEALTLAQKRVERLPKNANTFLLLGDTARRAGNMALAEKAYRQAAALDPKNAGALAGLSATAALQGNRDVALKLVNQRIARDPKNAALYFQKGYLYYGDNRLPNDQRFGQAEVAFQRATVLDPKNTIYQTYMGIALMMQGPFPHLPKDKDPPQGARGWDYAENYLRGAISLAPQNTMARLALASIAEQRHANEEALAQYRAILSYEPKDRDAHRGIAGVYYAAGKKADAYKEMEEIARLLPTETQTLLELASWYVADQHSADAQRTYELVLLRDPRSAPALVALGRLLDRDKKPVEAITRYQAAFAADPKNPQIVALLGSALSQANRRAEAIPIYRQFLNAVPDNNPVRWQLALTLRDEKQYDQALAEMQAITLREDDPNHTLYMLGAPNLLIAQKRFDEALRMLQQLQQEHPKEDEIRYAIADAYDKAGQLDKSEALLLEIANRQTDQTKPQDPSSFRSRILLGEMYERASKWEEAAGQYEDVLRIDPMQTTALYALSRAREKQNKVDAPQAFLESLTMADEKGPSLPAVGGIHQLFLSGRQLLKWREFTKRLVAKYPDNRDALYIRARSLTEEDNDENDRKEAISVYQKIVSKNPKDVNAAKNLAHTLESAGRKDEAMAAYKAVLKIQADDTDALAGIRRLGVK